jgi:ferredoxin
MSGSDRAGPAASATVDRTRCQGHGRCLLEAPTVFDVDDDGLAVVTAPPDTSTLEHARRAALACPEHAIDVRDRENQ